MPVRFEVQLDAQPVSSISTDAIVAYVFGDKEARIDGPLAELDRIIGGKIKPLAETGELTGKLLEMVLLHYPQGLAAQKLLLVGAGKPDKFTHAELRKIAGASLRYLRARGVKSFALVAAEKDRTPAAAQAIVEGLLHAEYDSDKYQTDKKPSKVIERVALAGFPANSRADIEAAVERGRIIGESENFARDLINEPSNRLTPRMLASRAEAMAREAGLEVDILDDKRIAELKMGALLGVAQGSVEPPRFIVVRYRPAQKKAGAPVLGLVGKAVTFDTGGISIKPAQDMEKMKYDMGGGATMLGVMRALARLKPSIEVIAVIPSTENMPGGHAQKPGDVQIAMSGKSIEVINTDAEGRLILADAICYAKKLGATHLIDAATLTGAIVVALANVHVGAFGTPREFLDRVLESARSASEKMWPMPIDDEYQEMIKSKIADIRNTGSGKGGGAITAAWFLKEFAEDTPWVHLDIAGTAWLDESKPWASSGPTGVAIRTLIDFAMRQ
ncbi:MAG TPA: leucyl aminopeptidase [Candidatus Acidoferrales bacterium]|nr:leucyl aminopeptidase [Candidatus Acidoferrales bacterium]